MAPPVHLIPQAVINEIVKLAKQHGQENHSLRNPEIVRTLLECAARNMSIRACVERAGISSKTFENWINRVKTETAGPHEFRFMQEFHRAKQELNLRASENVVRAVDEGNLDVSVRIAKARNPEEWDISNKFRNAMIVNNSKTLIINNEVDRVLSLPPDQLKKYITTEAQALGIDVKQLGMDNNIIEAELCESKEK